MAALTNYIQLIYTDGRHCSTMILKNGTMGHTLRKNEVITDHLDKNPPLTKDFSAVKTFLGY